MSDSGLASSSAIRPYPPRLKLQGKSLSPTHSMNHFSAMANLAIVREELGADVWSRLKNCSIGVFAKFADLDYKWAAKRAHYLLVNQLLVDDPHEIWSLIDDRPIRFSLHEFGAFTGLNCDAIPYEVCSVSHEEFWREMEISIATGPTFEELEHVMARSHLWDLDKRLMVAQLCLLSIGVLCIHTGSRIPLELAKLVLDQDAFEKYPWCRVSFEKLITSIKIMRLNKKSYTLQGPVQVLLTWLYEHVDGIGERYGKRKVKANETDPDEVPHLTWHSGRGGISFDKFITKEKAAHGKVRVTHMVEDIYPKWSDADKIDPLVKNMVEDIISGRLRENAWSEDEKKKKRKMDVEDKKDDSVDDAEMSNKKKKMKGKEHGEAMFNMFEKMTGDVDAIKYLLGDLARKVEANEINTEKNTEQQKELADMYSKIKNYFEAAVTKEKNVQYEEDVHSSKKVDDEASSASWMVQLNETSNKEFPSARVVKKLKENEAMKKVKKRNEAEKKEKKETEPGKKEKKQKNVQKKGKIENKDEMKEKTEQESEDNEKKQQESEDKEMKEQVIEDKEKKEQKAEKMKKKDEKQKKKVVVKIEKTDGENEKKAEACSEDSTWSNPKDKEATRVLDKAIDGLLNLTTNMDAGTPKPRREIKLDGSQKYPFVGNSTVKRIIKGKNVSPAHYDPIEVVDEFLLEKLLEFMKTDEEEPLLTKDTDRRFYMSIITPRDDWPSSDFGWLASGHICVGMTMFRNRHMRQPSPYCSQRIAFLDAFFMRFMQDDYPVYLAQHKNFKFRKTYQDNFFGLQPAVTNKRWFIDIDNLYGCLFVGTNHWVALDIDLKRNTIFIYDSIPPEDDTELQKCVRPIRKMIPAILSEYIPVKERKKSCAMMDVRRMLINVPVNENPGDCGVYSLKYIECLALGLKFDGLSDKIIQALRVKLACEIFDEVHSEVTDRLFDEYCYRKDVIPELLDEDVSDGDVEEL